MLLRFCHLFLELWVSHGSNSQPHLLPLNAEKQIQELQSFDMKNQRVRMEENKNLDGYLSEINRECRVLVENKGSFLIQPVELQRLPFPDAQRDNYVRSYTYRRLDYTRQRLFVSFITHELLWDQIGWIESIRLGKKHTYSPPYSWKANPIVLHTETRKLLFDK